MQVLPGMLSAELQKSTIDRFGVGKDGGINTALGRVCFSLGAGHSVHLLGGCLGLLWDGSAAARLVGALWGRVITADSRMGFCAGQRLRLWERQSKQS